jgi:hypothetical protein
MDHKRAGRIGVGGPGALCEILSSRGHTVTP